MILVAAGVAATLMSVAAPNALAASAAPSSGQPDFLCIFDPGNDYLCAYAQGSKPVVMTGVRKTTTNWYYPAGGSGEISQANSTNCMQVDASAGYTVIEAKCTGASYQEWNVVDDPRATGYYQWQSKYKRLTA